MATAKTPKKIPAAASAAALAVKAKAKPAPARAAVAKAPEDEIVHSAKIVTDSVAKAAETAMATTAKVAEAAAAPLAAKAANVVTAPAKAANVVTAPAKAANVVTAPAKAANVVTAPAKAANAVTPPAKAATVVTSPTQVVEAAPLPSAKVAEIAVPKAKAVDEIIASPAKITEAVAKIVETPNKALAVVGKGAEQAQDDLLKGVVPFLDFSRDNAILLVAAGNEFALGLQKLSLSLIDWSAESCDKGVAAGQAMLSAKSVEEVFDLSQTLAKDGFDQLMKEGSELSALSSRLIEDAIVPLPGRLAAAVEKLAFHAA